MSDRIKLPRLRPYVRQGKAYYAELRAVLEEVGNSVACEARILLAQQHTITVADLCRIALQHRLSLKATAEYLEDRHFLFCGTYGRLRKWGFRPTAALRETWAEMQREA